MIPDRMAFKILLGSLAEPFLPKLLLEEVSLTSSLTSLRFFSYSYGGLVTATGGERES